MKKKVYGRKLGRGRGARKALFRSLIRSLVEHGAIETTKAKAKAYQSEIDKLVNIAKSNTLSTRRRVLAKLGNDRKTTEAIFEKVVKSFSGRIGGGCTRIINLSHRRGDMAEMVRLEWAEDVAGNTKSETGTNDSNHTKKGDKRSSKLKIVAKKVISSGSLGQGKDKTK